MVLQCIQDPEVCQALCNISGNAHPCLNGSMGNFAMDCMINRVVCMYFQCHKISADELHPVLPALHSFQRPTHEKIFLFKCIVARIVLSLSPPHCPQIMCLYPREGHLCLRFSLQIGSFCSHQATVSRFLHRQPVSGFAKWLEVVALLNSSLKPINVPGMEKWEVQCAMNQN